MQNDHDFQLINLIEKKDVWSIFGIGPSNIIVSLVIHLSIDKPCSYFKLLKNYLVVAIRPMILTLVSIKRPNTIRTVL